MSSGDRDRPDGSERRGATAPVRTIFRAISVAGGARRAAFHHPPAELGLDFQFLDASTSAMEGTRFDPRLSYRHMRRVLAPGELGVYCSHVRAWRALLAHPDATQIVVLEDDVHADWPFLRRVGEHDWEGEDCHFVKFFGRYPAHFRVLRWHHPFRDRYLIRYTTASYGLQTYLLTRPAASRFERLLGTRITRPIDVEMERPWRTGIPVLGLVPSPVVELSIPTSITHRQSDGPETPLDDLRYFAHRAAERAAAGLYRVGVYDPARRGRTTRRAPHFTTDGSI